jgi:hypothetical protein
MQVHINDLTRLLADTQYHAPPGTPIMTDAQINLAFLPSLGPNYETFQQAMRDQTYRLKPGQLYARVKALAESKDEPTQRQIAALDETTRALAVRILNRCAPPKGSQGRFRDLRFKGRFIRPDNGGYRGYGRIGKPYTSTGNDGNTTNYDGNKTCRFCKRIGHVLEECRKPKWSNKQNGGTNNGDTEYRPGRPTFRANVTLITNNATQISYQDPDAGKWTIDSASNAHLIPFQFLIRNYRPFLNPSKGIGIGGKSVSALGYGSLTLTDKHGVKYTIKEIMYVPDSDRSILSLMGLHKQGLSFAFVEDTPIGAFTITSPRHKFQLDGMAIDKILYATEYPDSQ